MNLEFKEIQKYDIPSLALVMRRAFDYDAQIHLGVEQALVARCCLVLDGVGGVLSVAAHVLVLIQADAPVLHHRAVRALVAARAAAGRAQ